MTAPSKRSVDFDKLPKYRAPAGDRQALVDPPLLYAVDQVLEHQFSNHGPQFLGSPLPQLREQARSDALRAAVSYSSAYRDVRLDNPQKGLDAAKLPWLVAGHQPELFHPGVWFKNFLLSRCGQQANVLPLNLIIDNDLCRSPAIRVPLKASGDESIRVESVVFDDPAPAVAWECRAPVNVGLFDSFPDRVRKTLHNGPGEPLVGPMWKFAKEAVRRTGRLGLALAQARHQLEGELGLQTLELPLSQLCDQPSFARFSLELLRQLPRFQKVYNAQRAAYRTANGIRSETHPVPALSERHGWIEAPWWIYRLGIPQRKHLFAKLENDNLIISDQAGWQATLEGPLDGDDAVAQWQEFAVDGVMLRPRALITTMFVRMIVSDLFMHGIGGGKYDQLTDAIIRDFFGVEPPPMCVATATLHLPTQDHAQSPTWAQHDAAVKREVDSLRHIRFHPEEHLSSPSAEAQQLIAAKQELLRAIPPRGEKWEWHRKMTRIGQRLTALTTETAQEGERRLQQLSAESRQLKLIHSREFSFCLFESTYIDQALSDLAGQHLDYPSAK